MRGDVEKPSIDGGPPALARRKPPAQSYLQPSHPSPHSFSYAQTGVQGGAVQTQPHTSAGLLSPSGETGVDLRRHQSGVGRLDLEYLSRGRTADGKYGECGQIRLSYCTSLHLIRHRVIVS